MKLVQLRKKNGVGLGIQTDHGIIDVAAQAEKKNVKVPSDMIDLIKGGMRALNTVSSLVDGASCFSGDQLAPCITGCDKILCIGLNYRRHAMECNLALPASPVLFNKFSNALASDGDFIELPRRYIEYDYEAELVVVIGKEARNVRKEDALNYVFGYTCGNDLSTRDLQFARGGQWVMSKSFDRFAPVGPCIVTSDSLNPSNLDIYSRVNGELRQNSNTYDMIFSVAEIIEDLSDHFTLLPGDIIFTGTPEGVMHGYPQDKKSWLKPGDSVEVGIKGIGILRNSFV